MKNTALMCFAALLALSLVAAAQSGNAAEVIGTWEGRYFRVAGWFV
jgi:hypothetical protein